MHIFLHNFSYIHTKYFRMIQELELQKKYQNQNHFLYINFRTNNFQ